MGYANNLSGTWANYDLGAATSQMNSVTMAIDGSGYLTGSWVAEGATQTNSSNFQLSSTLTPR